MGKLFWERVRREKEKLGIIYILSLYKCEIGDVIICIWKLGEDGLGKVGESGVEGFINTSYNLVIFKIIVFLKYIWSESSVLSFW